MHANTALPCAWALGTLLVLTGCASRGSSTTHPLDLPVAPPVVASTRTPALRVPSPPSVMLLTPRSADDAEHHAVPLGRADHAHVQPALAAPVDRSEVRPAPCAPTPELTFLRPATRTRASLRPRSDTGGCAGGT